MSTKSDIDPFPLSVAQSDPDIVAAATKAGVPVPSRHTFYTKAVSGYLPAWQVGSRWYLDRKDMPAILSELGLAPVTPAKSVETSSPRAVALAI